jgi:hypothetical protein
VLTFAAPDAEPMERPVVTFTIEPFHEIVRLTVSE